MTTTKLSILRCEVVEEEVELSLADLCRACAVDAELIQQLVAHGVLEPRGGAQPQRWQFVGGSLRRARVAVRLLRDLELNLPGAALAVDLLDEIARLRHTQAPR